MDTAHPGGGGGGGGGPPPPPPPRKITIITILSFKISGGEFQAPPLYETLVSIAFQEQDISWQLSNFCVTTPTDL